MGECGAAKAGMRESRAGCRAGTGFITALVAAFMAAFLAVAAVSVALPGRALGAVVGTGGVETVGSWRIERGRNAAGPPEVSAVLSARDSDPRRSLFRLSEGLVIRCRAGALEAYIAWDRPLQGFIRPKGGRQPVTVRFDEEPARERSGTVSIDGRQMALPDPAGFIAALAEHAVLSVRTETFRGKSLAMVFDTEGSAPVVEEVLEACAGG